MRTTGTTTDSSEDPDELKVNIEGLRARLSALPSRLRALGVKQGREALARAKKAGERIYRQAGAARKRLDHELEERPLRCALTAFGAGLVIRVLLDRIH